MAWTEGSHMKHLHAVVLCLCVLGRVRVRLGRSERLLVLKTGFHKRRLLQSQLFTRVWSILDVYDAVVSFESPP